jgi:hypothetical protein
MCFREGALCVNAWQEEQKFQATIFLDFPGGGEGELREEGMKITMHYDHPTLCKYPLTTHRKQALQESIRVSSRQGQVEVGGGGEEKAGTPLQWHT